MEELTPLLDALVSKTYVRQGLQSITTRHNLFKSLLSSRELPTEGWDELSIELLLAELASMDSNNFPANIGAGEREGRVFSPIVARRHFRLSHGIGRSGDIAEVQPKSAGSSIIAKLSGILLLSALKLSGLTKLKHVQILPLATGMTLMMCLVALKTKSPVAKYVIFPRIDQKSCFKCIVSAGLQPLIVENRLVGDQLVTDIEAIEALLVQYKEEVLCVLSTTSCFAPRAPDAIDQIATLCQHHNIGHLINNAYGVQCRTLCSLINRAMTLGRVDYVVSSLDKNFMVPVGGAIVASASAENIALVSRLYPGRASITPALDLFITLLSMGKRTYLRLLAQREAVFEKLRSGLQSLAALHNERVLDTAVNPISLGLTLTSLGGSSAADVTYLGAMLFQRCVSGARVVPIGALSTIGGFSFVGWGSHSNEYPFAYMTVACAIGMTEEEVDQLMTKLHKTFGAQRAKLSKSAASVAIGMLKEQEGSRGKEEAEEGA